MNLLLHSCCGPCLGGAVDCFEENNWEVTAFWDNPNIHPYMEFKARLDSFNVLTEQLEIPVLYSEKRYAPERFFEAIDGDFSEKRCFKCFYLRLKNTVSTAKKEGFSAFSTTLQISPYQNRELLLMAALKLADEYECPFIEIDLRPFFPRTYEVIKKFELYKQKYCGCVFSEKERFENDRKHGLCFRSEKF